MPIFGRRQLQKMFDELGPWLVRAKANDLLKRLENRDPDQALPSEFELALSWAVSRIALLEIDRQMGARTPDIYSADMLASGALAIDVAAVSDVSLSGETLMRRAANILNLVCNEIVKDASAHLKYTFQERSGYVRAAGGRSRYSRQRRVSELFQMDAPLRSALAAWLSSIPPREPLRWTSEHIDVVVSWHEYVHPLSNTFSSMPSLAYDVRKNTLYKVLKAKARQLRQVPAGVHRAIFLGDAGCQLFNNIYKIDRVNHTFSGQQIIESFLAEENEIDFVAVFSVKRRTENSSNFHNNPRLWYLYVFENKLVRNTLDLSSINQLKDELPKPYLSGYEARSWHEQGMFSPQARGHYLPTQMSSGASSMTIRISARAVQELLAGKLTAEQFQQWTLGGQPSFNPFAQQLAAGWTISAVSLEAKGTSSDDDYLIFQFSDDPAALPLRLPNELKAEDRSPDRADVIVEGTEGADEER